MASTYSALKIELIGTGDQTGTWGATTNVNLGDAALGEAITGSADVAFSSADVTITLVDTNATQTARNLRLNLTGTSGGARNLILGSGCQIEKLYLVNNGLADAVTVKNTSGTGIAVPAGKTMFVYNNGTNVVEAVNSAVTLDATTIDTTNLEVTNIKAKDGTASSTIANSTGVMTVASSVLTTTDINGGTIDGTTIGVSSASTGAFTTINASTSITNAGLTSGRVTFAGASGLLSDSANLVWDNANTRLGIGTNPAYTLDLSSTTNGIIARFKSTSTYGQVVADNTSATGGGVFVAYQNGTNGSLFGVEGAVLGTTSTDTAIFTNVVGGAIKLYTNANATAKLTLDTSGNLGLGVTPSAWSVGKAMEFGNIGNAVWGVSATQITMPQNAYFNGAWRYAANGLATRYAQESGIHQWWNAPNNTSGAGAALSFTQAMTLNDSGNLSLSITPSSFGSTYKAFQAGGYAAYVGDGNNGYAEILNNAYASNNNIFNYYDTNSAGRYSIQLGAHKWFSTGSGSANAQITWTQAMTLDADGDLGIGTTNPEQRLEVRSAVGNPATSGSTQNGIIRVSNPTDNGVLDIGLRSGGNGAWLQSTDRGAGGMANQYALLLNPVGGNVGIGTSSPSSALDVVGTLSATGNISSTAGGFFSIRASGNSPILDLTQTGVYTWDLINTATTGVFSIRGNTNPYLSITNATGIVTMQAYGAGAATFSAAGVISSVSDETWKTKDGVPTNTDAMLQKLEPGYWFYNEEKAPIYGQDRQLGFYAQNVHEAIGAEAAPTPEEGKPWGYYDRSVLAVTVMSLKNALNTIEELKQRIEILENK